MKGSGFPKIREYLSGGPHNKGYSILVSILGSIYFGKLPYRFRARILEFAAVPVLASQPMTGGFVRIFRYYHAAIRSKASRRVFGVRSWDFVTIA